MVGKTTSGLRLAKSVISLPEDPSRLPSDLSAYLRSLPAPVLVDEWQLAGEREIDAIVEVAGGLIAFEVKHSTQPRPADAAHLQWLSDQFGDRFLAGFVVHTGGDAFPMADSVWALPMEKLCRAR